MIEFIALLFILLFVVVFIQSLIETIKEYRELKKFQEEVLKTEKAFVIASIDNEMKKMEEEGIIENIPSSDVPEDQQGPRSNKDRD